MACETVFLFYLVNPDTVLADEFDHLAISLAMNAVMFTRP